MLRGVDVDSGINGRSSKMSPYRVLQLCLWPSDIPHHGISEIFLCLSKREDCMAGSYGAETTQGERYRLSFTVGGLLSPQAVRLPKCT